MKQMSSIQTEKGIILDVNETKVVIIKFQTISTFLGTFVESIS